MIQGPILGTSSEDPFGSVAGMRQRLRGEDYRVHGGGSTGKTSHFLHLVAGSMQPVVGQPSAVQNFFSRQGRTADKRTCFVRRSGSFGFLTHCVICVYGAKAGCGKATSAHEKTSTCAVSLALLRTRIRSWVPQHRFLDPTTSPRLRWRVGLQAPGAILAPAGTP